MILEAKQAGIPAYPFFFHRFPTGPTRRRYIYCYKSVIRSPVRQRGFGEIEVFESMFPRLFHKRSTENTQEKADVTAAFKTLIDARFDRLEQNNQALRTEWADVYDKIMLLYDRTRKRIAVQKKLEKADDDTQPDPATPTLPTTREDLLRAYDARNGA